MPQGMGPSRHAEEGALVRIDQLFVQHAKPFVWQETLQLHSETR